MIRNLSLLALGLGLFAAAPVAAADELGVPVTVVVVDIEENPIPTAVVRHVEEKERHPVNTTTGAWVASVLYLADGTELMFEKGMVLQLEVSAPNFLNESVTYQVRRRRNKFTVTLQAMDLGNDPGEGGDPVIQFGRDKPLDGRPIEDEAE